MQANLLASFYHRVHSPLPLLLDAVDTLPAFCKKETLWQLHNQDSAWRWERWAEGGRMEAAGQRRAISLQSQFAIPFRVFSCLSLSLSFSFSLSFSMLLQPLFSSLSRRVRFSSSSSCAIVSFAFAVTVAERRIVRRNLLWMYYNVLCKTFSIFHYHLDIRSSRRMCKNCKIFDASFNLQRR